jgi:hypothetical protein
MATTVTGSIRIGEANRASFRSNMRAVGSSWIPTLGFLAAIVGIVALNETLPGLLKLPAYVKSLSWIVVLVLFWTVAVPGYFWAAKRNAVRRLRERGLSDPIPCTVAADDEAFTYVIGDITQTVRWRGVTDLFPVGRFWVVVAQGGRFYVPSRFFGSRSEERAWVAETLSHMSAAAQARAKEAARFVAVA